MNAAAPTAKSTNGPIPYVTLTVVSLNFLAACGVYVFPTWLDRYSLDPKAPTLLTAFTSLFLHENIIHLLGNLVYLAAVGPLLEFSRGRKLYVFVYLLSGLLGAGAYVLWSRLLGGVENPMVGASGAVAGCLGYASVMFFSKRVPVFPKVSVPVWTVGLVWVLLQGGGMFLETNGISGVAFVSHLTGFVAGLLVSVAWRLPKEQSRLLGHEVLDRLNSTDPKTALAYAEKHLKAHPGDIKAIDEAVNAYVSLDRQDEAVNLIDTLLASPQTEKKVEGVRLLKKIDRMDKVSSSRRLRIAEALSVAEPETAQMLFESVIEQPDAEPHRPHALIELASMLRETEPAKCRLLVDELVEKYPSDPATARAMAKGFLS